MTALPCSVVWGPCSYFSGTQIDSFCLKVCKYIHSLAHQPYYVYMALEIFCATIEKESKNQLAGACMIAYW